MKAEIKGYYSTEIYDLENYIPEQVDCFCFLLRILIGAVGEEGEDTLDFIVCTPKWLINEFKTEKSIFGEDIFFGKHYIIVFEYNFKKILGRIKELIDNVEEDTWDAIGQKLSRYGQWEFENYKEDNDDEKS